MWSNYETTYELLACVNPPGNYTCHSSFPETVPVLPWIPLTTAAVALRLLEFDTSLSYSLQQKAESQAQGSMDIKVSLSCSCPEFRLNQIDCFCHCAFLTSLRYRGRKYCPSLRRMDTGHNLNTFRLTNLKCGYLDARGRGNTIFVYMFCNFAGLSFSFTFTFIQDREAITELTSYTTCGRVRSHIG